MKFVACHGGVGFSPDLEQRCAVALNGEATAIGSVVQLESDPSFNCGYGSNLTWNGGVECEAGYMDSDGRFGAVAAVDCVKSPITLAHSVAVNYGDIVGLVPPMVVVGSGTREYAEKCGIPLCNPEELITKRMKNAWEKAKEKVEKKDPPTIEHNVSLDTVGAVQIEDGSPSIACCSSGGIALKQSGRMGHSAQFGAAVWAENKGSSKVAIAVSGLGEAIMRSGMARGIGEEVLRRCPDALPATVISDWMDANFTSSQWICPIPIDRRLAGGICIWQEDEDCPVELIAFHNTPFFPVAYTDKKGKVRTLRLGRERGNERELDSEGKFSVTSVLM